VTSGVDGGPLALHAAATLEAIVFARVAVTASHHPAMDDFEPANPRDLLDAWRNTLRAAELAERLALEAVAAADGFDSQAVTAATQTAVEVLASAERMAAHARHMLDETEPGT
jgi:hypothetical protein